MNESGHILITGVTGSVGSELVRWLCERAPGFRVTSLLRAGSPEELQNRWAGVLGTASAQDSEVCTPRRQWRPVAGDITLPNLGVSNSEYAALRKDVTHIIHAAADVQFLAPLEDLRRVNVEGTRNVLEFASQCPRLAQCAHISTLFVAGRRTGTILEQQLEHDAGFINDYERSKYEAELVAQKFMRVIPLAVYRLGLLPGRRKDGFVHQFGAFHQVLHFYHRGSLSMVPGASQNRIDIAPTDWAADVLMRMFLGRFEPGRTCHICSGEDVVQVGEFVALTNRCFSGLPRLGKPALAPLELVNSHIYERALNDTARIGTARSRHIVRTLNSTTPYAVLSRVFDRQYVRASLNGTSAAPAFKAYYPRIVRYCVGVNWRKHMTGFSGHAATELSA